MNLSIVIILVVSLIPASLQKCVWYDECNEENGKIQNCVAKDQSPVPFENETESFEILNERCPFFLKQYTGKEFCCNDKQLHTMVKSMNYAAGIFARCPTCLANLNKHICLMTCAPDQTDFLEAVETAVSTEGKEYIKKVNFYVNRDYMDGTYDSCKEIVVPSTGGKAVDISCGSWGATQECTTDRWFEFFGNFKENLVAPFDINYLSNSTDDKFKLADLEVLRCNESYEFSRACSCSDCEASCAIPFEYTLPPEPFVIGSLDGIVFIVVVTFAVVGTVTFVYLIRHHYFTESELWDDEPASANDSKLMKLGDRIKKRLETAFYTWGVGCAQNPVLVLAVTSWLLAALCYGAFFLQITTDPNEIWASPTSTSRRDKHYFDTRFAPFYRTNQVFIKAKDFKTFNWTSSNNNTYEFGPVFDMRFLEEVYNLQMAIQKLGKDKGVALENICFAPMKNEFFNENTIDYCTIQSIWGYLQNDIRPYAMDADNVYNKLQKCLRNNYDPTCLAPYGGPIFSPLAVGGHRWRNQDEDEPDNYLLARGLTLTFLLDNPMNRTDLEPALKWEKMFIEFLKDWTVNERPEFMEVAFSAERSIQDEIERESEAEMATIIISYAVMFLYIIVALGRVRRLSTLLLDTKFTLGFGGILIVLASVFASLGVFAYGGVYTTLLTIEVIPFLVLAVGVDNIFILVHTHQEFQDSGKRSVEENIGLALGKVGPSILLSSTSEAACFLIGTLSDMPAIKSFAQYSSLAIVLNFLLQISCFVSILSLDSKRQQANFADVLCCYRMKKAEPGETTPSLLHQFMRDYYAPFLMKPSVRLSTVMVFLFWLCASITCIPSIEKGLDQELSMPEDSYMVDYFKFMKELLSVGPPVYFVIKNGLNFTKPSEVNAVCGSVGCDSDSLVTYLTRASKLSNVSYIAKPPSSWIDDYFDWLNSNDCCKEFVGNGSFCPHQMSECLPCSVDVIDWRPRPSDFQKYLPYFLNDNPDMSCTKAGHAAYGGGVNFERNAGGVLEVKDNYFMTYHTPLKTSRDFYMALDNARTISRHLSKVLTNKLNRTVDVFPYSLFYVYYEQYLTIVENSLLSLGLSLLAIFAVTFLFTGFDLKSSGLVCFVVTCILVNMTGMLYWWNITLNAISLVNLLVSVGIGVEFCSHIMHAFRSSTGNDRIAKASHAITSMGLSVISGITLTKFLGIIVLAFAQTLMLRTFYFKMYFGIVLIGATHGLVLLPVLLSYIG